MPGTEAKKNPLAAFWCPTDASNFAACPGHCVPACIDSCGACAGMCDCTVTGEEEWDQCLCACFQDARVCAAVSCCFCSAFGRAAEAVDPRVKCETHCCVGVALGVAGCGQCYMGVERTRLREKYNIKGCRLGDVCDSGCPCCAVCQMVHELEMRRDAGFVGPSGTPAPAKQEMA